jgi:hypothetical protein
MTHRQCICQILPKIRPMKGKRFPCVFVSIFWSSSKINQTSSEWTDHARLSVDITLPRSDVGPGCWRLNPTLLEKIEFQRLLSNTVDLFFFFVPSSQDVQGQWEDLQLIVKYTTQQFSKNFHSGTKDRIKCLQQSRMKKLTFFGIRFYCATS